MAGMQDSLVVNKSTKSDGLNSHGNRNLFPDFVPVSVPRPLGCDYALTKHCQMKDQAARERTSHLTYFYRRFLLYPFKVTIHEHFQPSTSEKDRS